jgi:hypothetical protein
MTLNEIKTIYADRAQKVLNHQVNETVNYESGILLHAIPHSLLAEKPMDWSNREQSNCPKIAFRRFSDSQIQYNQLVDGYIGYTDREYTIWFDNGIIETFSSPIVQITDIPNAPSVNYIQVETIFMHSRNFMNAYLYTYERCFRIANPYSMMISLIGVKGVFFSARERNYTTTTPCNTNIYTFPIINYTGQSRNDYWNEILKNIHSTLMQLNPVR